MTNEIPRSARYDKIMETVHKFLINGNFETFPIDPISIIHKNRWGLITYSELAKMHHVSISEIIKSFQSEDGYVILDSNNYTIAYNDTIQNPGRIRFTLMHEIGHILLNHLADFNQTVLKRSKLTKRQYEILEREAHAFARNTLAPAIIVRALQLNWNNRISIGQLQSTFMISYSAALIRLQMLPWDLNHSRVYTALTIEKYRTYIYSITLGKKCTNCRYKFSLRNSKYCPICGVDEIVYYGKGIFNVRYPGVDLDSNLRATECPKCQNEEIEGDYCQICSSYLFNKCTGFDESDDPYYRQNVRWGHHSNGCDGFLNGNARYCPQCGSVSSFYEDGFLKAWDDPNKEPEPVTVTSDVIPDISDDDLPF